MGNYESRHNKRGLRKEAVFRCGKTGGTQTTPTVLTATDVLMFDRINEDKWELPLPKLKSEKVNEHGGGRKGNGKKYLGYEVVEKDMPMDLQTAMWLMYGLGTCVTTGTATPANTDIVASGQNTTTIVLTTTRTFARNALVGCSITIDPAPGTPSYHRITASSAVSTAALTLTITPAAGASANGKTVWFMGAANGADVEASGQNTATIVLTNLCHVAVNELVGKTIIINSLKYTVISNLAAASTGEALTLTLDKAVGASDDTKAVTWYTYPYTHTIAEANSLYSFIFHDEKRDFAASSATFDILREYYGILVKKVVIHLEPGKEVTCTATLLVGSFLEAKYDGASAYKAWNKDTGLYNGTELKAQTSFPEPFDEQQAKIFTYDMLDTTVSLSYFKYNGTSVEPVQSFWNEIRSMDITIENTDFSYEPVTGDKFPYKTKIKGLEYSIKVTGYTPNNNTLYFLRTKELSEYAGALTFKIRLSRDKTRNDDYIDLTFDSLELSDYPDVMVNITEAQVAVDFELVNAMKYTDMSNTAHAVGSLVVSALDRLDKRYYEDLV